MNHRLLSLRIIAGATTCAALAALAAGTALPARATGALMTPAGAGTRPVLLLNGDQVRTVPRPGGRAVNVLLPAPGSGMVYSLRTAGLAEYIPADALPYLGRGLAPSLFDLASLRRAETGGRLKVQVTFAGRRPDLPGLTITRTGPGRAEGYLTASSARVFDAALQRQFRADHGRASYGIDGTFAGDVTMSLPGAPVPAPSRPDFPMHTVTVTGTNLAGRPDTGDEVYVLNAADPRRFGLPGGVANVFYHGTARFSMPAGTYWAIAIFTSAGTTAAQRIVILPQFTVQGSHTRLRLAARSASSKLGASTPRPAALQASSFGVTRNGLHGRWAAFAASGLQKNSGVPPLWVSPTTVKPSVGSLHSYQTQTLASPAGAAGPPYAYNLARSGPAGIIPDQHAVISQRSLATVTERFYQDISSPGSTSTIIDNPDLNASVSVQLPVRLPGTQTEYMSGTPAVAYQTGYTTDGSAGQTDGQTDTWRVLHAGQKLTEAWNDYPLHPQPAVQFVRGSLARIFAEQPSAFRAGDKLWLFPVAFSDNVPGHSGDGFFYDSPPVKDSGSYAVFQDGVLIAHGRPNPPDSATAVPPATLSHKPSVIRFVLSGARRGRPYVLSPAFQTVWTWRSAPHPGATLPPSWYCTMAHPRRCVVQPMMTLDYHVHGLSLHGTTAPGPQSIGVTVGHLHLGGHAPITGAAAQVSYNGGRTWRPATVRRVGTRQFMVSFTAPARAEVTLRTRATDAAGGSIAETIQDAYRS